MLNDVLLINENHRKAARQILDILNKTYSLEEISKLVITIGGESGSGKSEISHEVSRFLREYGIYAKIIHTDNYYKIKPSIRNDWRKARNFDEVGLEEIDWDHVENNITDFKNDNKKAVLPCIDILTDQVDTLITNFEEIRILILDGLYCLNTTADLHFMIDLTYHETKKAQLLRGKEILDENRLKILEKEHQSVQSLRNRATYFINKDFDIIKTDH
jgi:uridine kinase